MRNWSQGNPQNRLLNPNRSLETDLNDEVQALLAIAQADGLLAYKEFPKASWPPLVQRLNQVAVVNFDSKSHPDEDEIIIVVEHHRD